MSTLTVVGNCQAESLRKLLMSSGHFESERITPVHGLRKNDMMWFRALIARTDILVTQPIRDNYRGLPVGTSQLIANLKPRARHVVVPVLRFDALMPYQAIIRDPDDSSLDPPVVPYHDLRILAAVARGADSPISPLVSSDALNRAADMSIAQMRSREQRHGAVVMSDYLETTPVWHTVNHPNNETLVVLAERVLESLGMTADVNAPAYEMLGELDAPIDPAAAETLGVSITGRKEWTRRAEGVIPDADIVSGHMDFYRARPALVAHGLKRHADRLRNLGLV